MVELVKFESWTPWSIIMSFSLNPSTCCEKSKVTVVDPFKGMISFSNEIIMEGISSTITSIESEQLFVCKCIVVRPIVNPVNSPFAVILTTSLESADQLPVLVVVSEKI